MLDLKVGVIFGTKKITGPEIGAGRIYIKVYKVNNVHKVYKVKSK